MSNSPSARQLYALGFCVFTVPAILLLPRVGWLWAAAAASVTALLCAAVILLFAMATVCYAADIGGIRRTVQIWVHGDQTSAVMDIQDGQYTLTYQDAEGKTHERGGGGVALGPFGSERPLTEEELLEHLDNPEVEYKEDGSVWLYYRDQAMEITDRFDADGFCFVQLKTEAETLYITVKYNNGYAISGKAFIQPEEFN